MTTPGSRKLAAWRTRAIAVAVAAVTASCAHGPTDAAVAQRDSQALLAAIAELPNADAPWVWALTAPRVNAANPNVILDDPATVEIRSRARQPRPGDPVSALAALQVCRAAADCDVASAALALAAIDPASALPLLPEFDLAVEKQDDVRIEAALRALATRPEWNIHWSAAALRTTRVFHEAGTWLRQRGGRPRESENAAFADATGVLAGSFVPPFYRLSGTCRDVGDRPQRREACLRIARSMQDADAVMVQAIGYGIELKLHPPDSTERLAAQDALRRVRWHLHSVGRLNWHDGLTREIRELTAASAREADVFETILRRRGMALDPPKDWNTTAG